ncbi:hypothetical protein [Peptoniphilus grossensis]|uniref:hypothetical protein n=1 Tax=Peptoniphilus grossensis TaxID=1465756 RepID=UPI0040679BB7
MLLKYKNFIGSMEYDSEDKIYYGQLLGISALVGYDGKTNLELEKNFKIAVDDFINYHLEKGMEVPTSYKELLTV